MSVHFTIPNFPLFNEPHSKNELEGAKGPVTGALPAVGTTDKNPDPVLVQGPASRADRLPLQN